jgi:dihydroorotase
MSQILIKGGRVVDPSQRLDRVTNVLLEEGRVAGLDVDEAGDALTIDATNRVVTPGLIDMHVELREPGFEEDETIATGTAAALAGGFTSIACLPNTDPPIDTQASVEFVQHQAARADACHVLVIACVSKGQQGSELAEIGSLAKAGAVGFSDAPSPIHNPELMRRALEYCRMFHRPVLNHPEVRELTVGGIMHEGLVSLTVGLGGMPPEAEDMMVARDLRLSEATGERVHLMNISSAGCVDLIRRAKDRGVTVTAEITPAHFSLTDDCLRTFDSNFKINPPLRSQFHVDHCIEGLKAGTLDVIASGHAPRAAEKKMRELDLAPFGMSALETTLAAVITFLIEPGHLDWTSAVEKLSCNPARILGQSGKGTLRVGADADVTIIDPHWEWEVSADRFRSKSSSSPFLGRRLRGIAQYVIVGGKVKWTAGM